MKQKKPTKQIIRYWHPRLGGWYHATITRAGYKWAIVREFSGKQHRVPVADVREVAA